MRRPRVCVARRAGPARGRRTRACAVLRWQHHLATVRRCDCPRRCVVLRRAATTESGPEMPMFPTCARSWTSRRPAWQPSPTLRPCRTARCRPRPPLPRRSLRPLAMTQCPAAMLSCCHATMLPCCHAAILRNRVASAAGAFSTPLPSLRRPAGSDHPERRPLLRAPVSELDTDTDAICVEPAYTTSLLESSSVRALCGWRCAYCCVTGAPGTPCWCRRRLLRPASPPAQPP